MVKDSMKHLLKGFRKVNQDENCTTFEHPNGHQIRVAHKSVNKDLQRQLKDLPNYSEGGYVKNPGLHADYTQDQKRMDVQQSMNKSAPARDTNEDKKWRRDYNHGQAIDLSLPNGMADGGEIPDNTIMGQFGLNDLMGPNDAPPNMSPMSMEQANSEQPNIMPEPTNIAPPVTQEQPINAQDNNYQNTLKSMQSGIMNEARATGQQGRQEAQAAATQQNELNMIQQNYEKERQDLAQERMNAYNDFQSGHIEPNHYVQNMNGFGQAMTAIGIALGGASAGILGGENQALKVVQNQIDRDIDAQRAELGKKQNLVSMLEKQMGDLKDATIMAKAMQTDMYLTKMQQIAAASKNPIAMAKAQQLAGQLSMQIQPQIDAVAQRQAALKAMQNGQLSPVNAINILVPKEDTGKATEELGKHQIAQKSMKMVNDTLDKAFKVNSLGNRTKNPIQSREQLKAMEVNLLGVLKPIFNNFSETDKEQALANMPSLTDNAETLANKKQNMQNLIKVNISTPTLDRYNIKLPEFISTRKAR